jgi:hypothetical protein
VQAISKRVTLLALPAAPALASFIPGLPPVVRRLTHASLPAALTRERRGRAAAGWVPRREVVVAAVGVVSRLVGRSLEEDRWGVVQRDVGRVVEALVAFLGEVEGAVGEVGGVGAGGDVSGDASGGEGGSQEERAAQMERARARAEEEAELEEARAVLGEVGDGEFFRFPSFFLVLCCDLLFFDLRGRGGYGSIPGWVSLALVMKRTDALRALGVGGRHSILARVEMHAGSSPYLLLGLVARADDVASAIFCSTRGGDQVGVYRTAIIPFTSVLVSTLSPIPPPRPCNLIPPSPFSNARYTPSRNAC